MLNMNKIETNIVGPHKLSGNNTHPRKPQRFDGKLNWKLKMLTLSYYPSYPLDCLDVIILKS